MLTTMPRLAVLTASLAIVASCGPSDDAPPPQKQPPHITAAPTPTITINGSYPDKPPEVFISLLLSDSERTPTSLSLEKVALLGDASSDPLATLHGEVSPSRFDFTDGPTSSTYVANVPELSRDLVQACAATRVEIQVRGSACACPIVVKSDARIDCLLDARADVLLADPGLAAPAGKPCAMKMLMGETLDEEHRYRYGQDGRLRFLDVYDDKATLTERRAYTHEPSGYLRQVDTIKPDTRLINARKTYTYDATGLLTEIALDGSVVLDGAADWTTAYALSGTTWTETTTYADPTRGVRTATYVYDAQARTVTGDGLAVVLAGPLASPNDLFAAAPEVEMPKIVSSGGATFTYDATGRLASVDYAVMREDYFYVCP